MSRHRAKADPVSVALSIPIFMIVGGVLLATGYITATPCGRRYIGAKDQVYCYLGLNDHSDLASVEVNGTVVPKGLTTYLFAKEPKRVTETIDLPDHEMKDVIFSSYIVPYGPGTRVTFTINATSVVEVEYVATLAGNSETLYPRRSGQDFTDSFVIEKEYYNAPQFIITGNDIFSGVLHVSETVSRFDVDSSKSFDKCSSYPCEFDLTQDELQGKTLYLVTDNKGNKEFDIASEEKVKSIGSLVGGIILAAAGAIITILAVLCVFICLCD